MLLLHIIDLLSTKHPVVPGGFGSGFMRLFIEVNSKACPGELLGWDPSVLLGVAALNHALHLDGCFDLVDVSQLLLEPLFEFLVETVFFLLMLLLLLACF